MSDEVLAFEKVLIANRGEIACRVIRACADAGLTSIACYATIDADMPFVGLADLTVELPGGTAKETYLSHEAVLAAAIRTGADAIHPGYGFLSEDAEFAEVVVDAGLIWIGPSPSAMRLLSDKVSARQLAASVGAPLAAGTDEAVLDPSQALAFAAENGLPIAIKAAHGGGGRGLKVVHRLGEVESQFESAVREAEVAFGRGECFVERYLEKARHVEAQIIADRHGLVVVAGTRDCSLQRRHQKLVEEAPAPFLTDEQRASIHESSKRLISAAGYVGAGTVEFLVGLNGTVSFLEVNTRLQVEHPVTEATTGLDLVREQFRIASGLPLSVDEDPEPNGHAFEFRLNAEDPFSGFLPTPGVIEELAFPAWSGVRIDSGVRMGTEIGGEFDSLLAKVIVWGPNRDAALRRSRVALADITVEGITTVLPFHQMVVDEPAFVGTAEAIDVHTRWIEENLDPELLAPGTDELAPGEVSVAVGRASLQMRLPGLAVLSHVVSSRISREMKATVAAAAVATGDSVVSPMQGTVVSIVPAGTEVAEGEMVVVVEAMKMENVVRAPQSGVVTDVAVAVGDSVGQDHQLCRVVADG